MGMLFGPAIALEAQDILVHYSGSLQENVQHMRRPPSGEGCDLLTMGMQALVKGDNPAQIAAFLVLLRAKVRVISTMCNVFDVDGVHACEL
jgi:hypothetical protein